MAVDIEELKTEAQLAGRGALQFFLAMALYECSSLIRTGLPDADGALGGP